MAQLEIEAKSVELKSVASTGCCPPFDPEPWRDKEVHWQEKLFLRDHVVSLFHIPLNMRWRMAHNVERIAAAGATAPQPLMLSDEASPWGANLYIDVTKPVPGAQMARLSGTFFTRVFEGPYREMGRWADQMKEAVKARGQKLVKLYFAYTTCPSCSKAYGKNYVVGFAQIEGRPS